MRRYRDDAEGHQPTFRRCLLADLQRGQECLAIRDDVVRGHDQQERRHVALGRVAQRDQRRQRGGGRGIAAFRLENDLAVDAGFEQLLSDQEPVRFIAHDHGLL